MSKVLLTSGGPDSLIAWNYLDKPLSVFVDLRHKYADQERRVVAALYDSPLILEVGGVSSAEQSDAFFPARNLLLCTLASYFGDEIFIALQKGELELYDRSIRFCRNLSVELSEHHRKAIRVDSPFWDMTKVQLVRWYLEKDLPVGKLLFTRSCYSSEVESCAACGACFRRWIAFSHNGLHEDWYSRMVKWPGIQHYIEKMSRGEYDALRTEETMTVLKRCGVI